MRIPIWTNYWEGVRELIADIRAYIQYRRDRRPDTRPPILLTDEVLGTFRFDRRACWFVTQRPWNGVDVSLSLESDWQAENPNLHEASRIAKTARTLWDDEVGWLKRMQEVAVRDLLELAREWHGDHGPLDESAFLARLQICAISLSEDGSFTADFDVGDIFGEHTVELWGTLQDGPEEAGIAG